MRRIAFLLGNKQGNGGIARVTSILANEMVSECNVHVISFCLAKEKADYQYDKRIHFAQLFDGNPLMAEAILKKRACEKLKKYLSDNDIDILIACGQLFFPLGIISCKGIHTKCFCWEHTNPYVKTDNKFQMLSRRFAALFADKIIVLTKATQRFYIEKIHANKKKVIQIYNPIGKEAFQSEIYNVTSKRILSVGRLTPPKNYECLLSIAHSVLPSFPEWCWDICGEGEEHEKLQEIINQYHLENRVHLRGQVNNIYSIYKNYAFIVMTSKYEGFPMTLVEALANRLPLLAFDVPTGPNEIIQDCKNGFLVDAFDTNKMEKKIIELIRNQNMRTKMSNEAFKSSKLFKLDYIMNQWRSICEF